jgi:enamine deaminase RidA (YjgF/YER057c/UK114 family)
MDPAQHALSRGKCSSDRYLYNWYASAMLQTTHVNASEVPTNPAFTHAVSVSGPARTIYVGGQNAVNRDGAVDGDDAGTQTTRTLENLQHVLAAAGAGLPDVVYWSISIVQGASIADAVAAFRKVWGTRSDPPAISVNVVSGLANPRFLVEICATAVVGAE